MIELIVFAAANYFLVAYFKKEETAYLYLGSLILALTYILTPVVIFLLPLYSLIFYFQLVFKDKDKAWAQLFTFILPSLAVVFSLSYISWLYGNGFRLIYLNNGLFNSVTLYSGNLDYYAFASNLISNLIFIALSYFTVLLYFIFKKGLNKPYLYLFIMPVLLQFIGYFTTGLKTDISFYIIYLFFVMIFLILFSDELSLKLKRIYSLAVISNIIITVIYLSTAINIYLPENYILINQNIDSFLNSLESIVLDNWPGPSLF